MYSIYKRKPNSQRWELVETISSELGDRCLWALRFYSSKPLHIIVVEA